MDLFEPLAAIALVFGLLAGTVWVLRRRGLIAGGVPRARKAGCLSPVERLGLTPQHSVHLVRVGGKAMVIAVYPGGCSLLDSLPWNEVERHGGGAL